MATEATNEKIQRAHELWAAGNNAELSKVITELEAVPEDENARELAQELRKRLRPDPIAIALWVITFGIFCYLVINYIV